MSYTRLRYHIVTATKNRAEIITPEVEGLIQAAVRTKAEEHGAKILKIGGVADHIHVVAAIPATMSLADFVRELKTASSRAVNRAGEPEGRFNWQEGYGAFTLNPYDLSGILSYVANQKRHHAENALWPAYERVEDE